MWMFLLSYLHTDADISRLLCTLILYCYIFSDCITCLHLFFVLDYMSGGDLRDQLAEVKVFSQERAQFYVAQITLALQFLHKRGILHR